MMSDSCQAQTQNQNRTHRATRLKLPAMYTFIHVCPHGMECDQQSGHIYDISDSGMRFELDNAIMPGTSIDVRALLPGRSTTTFRASGHVVRMHDDLDEPGPLRMAMQIDHFQTDEDHSRLSGYLASHQNDFCQVA